MGSTLPDCLHCRALADSDTTTAFPTREKGVDGGWSEQITAVWGWCGSTVSGVFVLDRMVTWVIDRLRAGWTPPDDRRQVSDRVSRGHTPSQLTVTTRQF